MLVGNCMTLQPVIATAMASALPDVLKLMAAACLVAIDNTHHSQLPKYCSENTELPKRRIKNG